MPAEAAPVYLGKTESVQVEVFCFTSKTFSWEIQDFIIQITSVAALANGGASQAAGLVSGVSFIRGTEIQNSRLISVIFSVFLLH